MIGTTNAEMFNVFSLYISYKYAFLLIFVASRQLQRTFLTASNVVRAENYLVVVVQYFLN